MNPWLIFSLLFLLAWLLIWLSKPRLRKKMFWISLFTMPFGLTEPLFVPEYWNPPALFNLAARTGFDIESLIFSFAIGGIGSVIYETLIKTRHKKVSKHEMHGRRHRFHLLSLSSPIIIFLLLFIFTRLNSIYSASIAMFIGSVASLLCRPDLKKKIWLGGIMFFLIYFIFFLSFNLIYPGIVYKIWNLNALSGILIVGIPLEELIFAFTFGMMWSSVYEHVMWYKVQKK